MNVPAIIEPIPLPDLHRMGQMPSLPGWAASQAASVERNQQRDQTSRKYREVWTLPARLMPTEAQAIALRAHAAELRRRMTQTPEQDGSCAEATLVFVTKLLLALPRAKTNEVEAEAKAEAYMEALDDVPSWAVQAAIRNWHRSGYGPDHDYRWAPVPSELRQAAETEAWKSGHRIQICESILNAVELFEPEPSAAEAMKVRVGQPALRRM